MLTRNRAQDAPTCANAEREAEVLLRIPKSQARTGVIKTAWSPEPHTTALFGSGVKKTVPLLALPVRHTKRCVSDSRELLMTTSSICQLPDSGPITIASSGPRFGPAKETSSKEPRWKRRLMISGLALGRPRGGRRSQAAPPSDPTICTGAGGLGDRQIRHARPRA